jgi:FixJ family two-component response regulator
MAIAGRKILVVEDDDGMRDAIVRLLTVFGLNCVSYVSAEALLSDRARHHAACIISDLKLPSMSGFELLSVLRAHGEASHFILITAHDVPGLQEEAALRGADACLVKPFLGTALLRAVEGALAGEPE